MHTIHTKISPIHLHFFLSLLFGVVVDKCVVQVKVDDEALWGPWSGDVHCFLGVNDNADFVANFVSIVRALLLEHHTQFHESVVWWDNGQVAFFV
jgi:hypothetical protein